MSRKEEWIERMIKSEDYIGVASPSDELLRKLKAIPSKLEDSYNSIPKKVIWSVAASFALLICLNFTSVNKYNSVSKRSASQSEELSETYFSYLEQI